MFLLKWVIDARRHVNKMCMAGGIPSVESGTAGYLGQVQPLLKVRLYTSRVCMFLRVCLLEQYDVRTLPRDYEREMLLYRLSCSSALRDIVYSRRKKHGTTTPFSNVFRAAVLNVRVSSNTRASSWTQSVVVCDNANM